LYLVHGLPPEEYSGTPLVAHSYASTLGRQGWDVAVVFAAGPAPSWRTFARRLTRGLDRAADAGRADPYLRLAVPRTAWAGTTWSLEAASHRLNPKSYESVAFGRILEKFRPDLVHVVDNVNLPLDLPELAARAGIPVVRTVSCAEDLCALVAPVSALSGPMGYCEAPITPQRCAECVAAEPERLHLSTTVRMPPPEALDGQRTAEHGRVVVEYLEGKRSRAQFQFREVFDRVVFSTRGFRDYFCQSLEVDPSRVRVIGMGMETAVVPPERATRARDPDAPVVFGLAGVLDLAKGQRAVMEAFSRPPLSGRADWRLRFFGGGDPAVIAPLLELPQIGGQPRAEWSGPYTPEQLPGLLAQVDVGLSTSRFETFHRVTREYLLNGLPVVTSPTFGAVDVVSSGVNGLVYEPGVEGGLAKACLSVLEDRALLTGLSEGACSTKIRTLAEEVDELTALYEEVLMERRTAQQAL